MNGNDRSESRDKQRQSSLWALCRARTSALSPIHPKNNPQKHQHLQHPMSIAIAIREPPVTTYGSRLRRSEIHVLKYKEYSKPFQLSRHLTRPKLTRTLCSGAPTESALSLLGEPLAHFPHCSLSATRVTRLI